MDENGYPEIKELLKIKNWDFKKGPKAVIEFINYIESKWQYADAGYFSLKGKDVLRLELHTAGWSGNENIIEYLKKNFIFWVMCWQKSTRGGHYYFKINLKLFKPYQKEN